MYATTGSGAWTSVLLRFQVAIQFTADGTAPSWADGRKSKSSLVGGDGDVCEAGGLETRGERLRVNGDQGVGDVVQAHQPAIRAVDAGKDAAGAEDAADLLEEPVLELDGGNVVEHGEGYGR